jgi:hypothetical protein
MFNSDTLLEMVKLDWMQTVLEGGMQAVTIKHRVTQTNGFLRADSD